MEAFEGVDVALVVSISTLRTILKGLRADDGRRWWLGSDPADALDTGWIRVGFGDQLCTDPLNTVYFRIPVLEGFSRQVTERLLLFAPSTIVSEETGYYLETGRFVSDTVGDFEAFYCPLKTVLARLLVDGVSDPPRKEPHAP